MSEKFTLREILLVSGLVVGGTGGVTATSWYSEPAQAQTRLEEKVDETRAVADANKTELARRETAISHADAAYDQARDNATSLGHLEQKIDENQTRNDKAHTAILRKLEELTP